MFKTALGAQRYNNRINRIWETYKRQQRFLADAIANHGTMAEIEQYLVDHGYSPETARHYAEKKPLA